MAEHAPLPPQALDAEESILGAMMLSPRAIDAIADVGLAARDFYRPTHGVIYDACLALYADDKPVDGITVADKLSEQGKLDAAGGAAHVHELAALVPSASNAAHYARIVRDHSVYRRLIEAGEAIRKLGFERGGEVAELIDQAEQEVFELALTGRAGDFVALSEPLHETFQRIEAAQAAGNSIVGLPSGFGRLDNLTSGFEPGSLIIVAARPSMGKTGFALNIASHVSLSLGKTVGLFTLEMSRGEVTQRMLSSEALVDGRKIRNGRVVGDDWSKLLSAAGRLHEAPLQIDDSGTLTAMEIRAKARRLKLRHPDLALIIVDYLQLMTAGSKSGDQSRVQDVSQISRALKVLAGDVGVPVIALSQLSRGVEGRHDRRPILSDLRESGSIEQDADIVMFIYRDEYYHPDDTDQLGIAEVNLAKHRNGPTGMIKLAWVSRYTRFTDLADDPTDGA